MTQFDRGTHPYLTTRRLDLAPLTVADADEMIGVLADESLYAFIGGRPPTLGELRDRYGRLVAGGSGDGREEWHNWIARRRTDGRAVGTLQATIVDGGRSADIAWVIGAVWQRRGLASEAAQRVVGWLESRGVRTISAHVHPEHRASAMVAERAGLSPTAEMDDGEQVWRRTSRA